MITHTISSVTVDLTLPNESEYESFLFACLWCDDVIDIDGGEEYKTRYPHGLYNFDGLEAFGIDKYFVLEDEGIVTFSCRESHVEQLAALVKGAIEAWVREYKNHVIHDIGVAAGNDAMQDYIGYEANRLNIKL